ncbi:HFR061Wp [Eremothecium sinecaudum]|uniref:HFR061Wp n=1 Tax=Eremothecium sinecaudum TaxID=45286 RepID=A0A109UZW5_9SACH|nr:HFR061Wp [Eremothecium sinecaudum]AMD21916.1 HFR061Wp [Eremothecium sinecaudum]
MTRNSDTESNECKTTPTLVGTSVRDIDDAQNPDYCTEKALSMHGESSSHILERIHSHTNIKNHLDSYESIQDLNREGALLTDDNDVDLEQLVTEKLEGISALKQQLTKKKNSQASRDHQHPPYPHSARLRSSGSSVNDPYYSHVSSENSNSSLAISTDPIEDSMSMGSASSHQHTATEESTDTGRIRNLYGEFIPSRSHIPHLARGDSYQKTGVEGEERLGRSSNRGGSSSADYLRSLSRSMQRGNSLQRSNANEQQDDKNITYNTNNYIISQIEMEMAPLVIREDEEDRYKESPSARPPQRY